MQSPDMSTIGASRTGVSQWALKSARAQSGGLYPTHLMDAVGQFQHTPRSARLTSSAVRLRRSFIRGNSAGSTTRSSRDRSGSIRGENGPCPAHGGLRGIAAASTSCSQMHANRRYANGDIRGNALRMSSTSVYARVADEDRRVLRFANNRGTSLQFHLGISRIHDPVP
jgi:hypothetical protein